MRTCVVLPAYNEANNISNLIKRISLLRMEVLVVDDGSTDGTAEVAESSGAVVIRHQRRRGKGASIKDGLDYAKKNGYDIIITMDADGQHDPREIPLFMQKAADRSAKVVIGNRLANPTDMPLVRLLTNKFMSSVISVICRQKIPDTQCGFRLFYTDAINSISIETHKFEIESELLVKLSKKGYKIESLPIKSIYAGEKSRINPVTDTLRFIRFIGRMLFKD